LMPEGLNLKKALSVWASMMATYLRVGGGLI
jgi:hypothetical protein